LQGFGALPFYSLLIPWPQLLVDRIGVSFSDFLRFFFFFFPWFFLGEGRFFWEYFWRSSGALLSAAVGAGGVGKQSALQRALFFVASSFWRSFVSSSEDSARNIFTERSFSSELQWFHRSEVCTDAAFSLLCEFARSLSFRYHCA
jgi:hypothetical protein